MHLRLKTTNHHLTIKNRERETRIFNARLIVSISVVMLLTLLLLCRLFYLQIIQHRYYTTLSEQNEIDLVPIAPRRGLIYDRHGELLANNIPVFSLMATRSKISHLTQALKDIQQVTPLSENDLEQFNKHVKERRRFEQTPLKLKLSEEEVAKFSLDQFRFPGFSLNVQLIRQYPFSNSIAHVIGYVGRINEKELAQLDAANYSATHFIGKTGIERYYESALHGKVGYQKVEIDASGRIIRDLSTTYPIRGIDLYLTIDKTLQNTAEEALSPHRGAIVALNPKTGEVLALVSEPSYNPSLFIGGITVKDFQALLLDKSHPLYNRTIHGVYPPGSTIKPFIAIAGLDSGLITSQFQIFDPGWYQLPHTSHIFHDWKKTGHGWTNLSKAIIESVDTYFYDLAHKIGIQRIDAMLQQFGFNEKTGIDLPHELEGNIPSPEWKWRYRGKSWYPGDTVLTGIGQGYVLTTPLQLAVATSVLANHGVRYRPHLLYCARFANGKIYWPSLKQQAFIKLKNPHDWDTIIQAMSKVTTEGTGTLFGKSSYSIAAKTGTAQVIRHDEDHPNNYIPERFRNNSVFIAFAPIENPKIVIAVVVENSPDAPIVARKILDDYLLHHHGPNVAEPPTVTSRNTYAP